MNLLQPRSVQFVNGDVSPADWKYAGLLSPNAPYKLQLSRVVIFFRKKFLRRYFKIQDFLAGSLAVARSIPATVSNSQRVKSDMALALTPLAPQKAANLQEAAGWLELRDAQVYSSGTHDVYKQFHGCKHCSRPRPKKNKGALWLDLPRYHGQWQEDAWVECDLSRLSSLVLMP